MAAMGECHFLLILHCCLGCLLCGSWAGWTEHKQEVLLIQLGPSVCRLDDALRTHWQCGTRRKRKAQCGQGEATISQCLPGVRSSHHYARIEHGEKQPLPSRAHRLRISLGTNNPRPGLYDTHFTRGKEFLHRVVILDSTRCVLH